MVVAAESCDLACSDTVSVVEIESSSDCEPDWQIAVALVGSVWDAAVSYCVTLWEDASEDVGSDAACVGSVACGWRLSAEIL